MNRIALIALSAILMMTACNKSESSPAQEESGAYIFFSQRVQTKAPLIGSTASMNGKTFGVVGYKYANTTDWNAVKSTATPTVFATTPQPVTCDENGYGTYSPLQGWSNTQKYAFFAYYPTNATLVNTTGVPVIKYTLAEDDSATDANEMYQSMADVMTATPRTDLYWNSASSNNVASGEVTLSFAHRLSCVGVKIKNSTNSAITVSKVDFTVAGIQNKDITIPLDGSAATPVAATTPMSASFSLSLADTDKSIPVNTTSQEEYKELSDKLIFIPQSGDLTISKFQITFKRGTAPAESFIVNDLTTALEEGKKHLISLNIKESTVDVSYKFETNAWTDINDVYDTFN